MGLLVRMIMHSKENKNKDTERFGQAGMQASSPSQPLDPLVSSREFEGTPENNPRAMCFRQGGKDSVKSENGTVKG